MTRQEQRLVDGMLEAYRHGYFPMADPERAGIDWYNPDPRAIVPLDAARISRSLRQRVRSGRFRVTADAAFPRVIRACAAKRPREPRTWIDARIIRAYTLLHRAGHAHSIEAWLAGKSARPRLVGGLYGVHIGGAFMGESMFSRPRQGGTDASKVCFVHLVEHLRRRGFTLLDTQFISPHMARLGAVEIPAREYLSRLKSAAGARVAWGPFEPDAALAER